MDGLRENEYKPKSLQYHISLIDALELLQILLLFFDDVIESHQRVHHLCGLVIGCKYLL